MTHISIMSANLFAMQMVMEAVTDSSVTFFHPTSASVRRWRHVDIVSNDVPAATFTIGRDNRLSNITAHCEMEYEGHRVVRGTVELIIDHRTWNFTAHIVDNLMEVHGALTDE